MIERKPFGQINGQQVDEITLTNKHGMSVSSCPFGCIITAIWTPDKNGQLENVVCSFKTVEDYLTYPQFFGAAIGPFAGRLEDAVVEINGERHETEPNEGKHLLHSGKDGFHSHLWAYETGECERGQFVRYTLQSSFRNFPGNVEVAITYTLTEQNELLITYEGKSDTDTLMNCTNHSYFNLSGQLKRTIEQHSLQFKS